MNSPNTPHISSQGIPYDKMAAHIEDLNERKRLIEQLTILFSTYPTFEEKPFGPRRTTERFPQHGRDYRDILDPFN